MSYDHYTSTFCVILHFFCKTGIFEISEQIKYYTIDMQGVPRNMTVGK